MFRVVSGKATKDTGVENVSRKASERFGSLIVLQGKKVDHVDEAASVLELGECPRCSHRWTRPIGGTTHANANAAFPGSAVRELLSADPLPHAA